MNKQDSTDKRCAIYTRKSSVDGLEQEFNSLHAQREACEAYTLSQQHEGWVLVNQHYDDGGFSGGNTARPALQALRSDIEQGLVDLVLVYKVDRLSRSLSDFVRLVEFFDEHNVAFASVTQQFDTSTSMGKLTLNVLLSFAQFEREVTGERIRDKISASKKKGMWMGGRIPLGYDVVDRKLVENDKESKVVRHIYNRYLSFKNVRELKTELDDEGYRAKQQKGRSPGKFSRGALYNLLKNRIYIGQITHKGECYKGEHDAILDADIWTETQTLLLNNSHEYKTRGEHPSLLAGLLFDDNGNSMSPTHTKKGSLRYRYYISQALLQYREADAGSVQRVPAQAIEDIIGQELNRLFLDHGRLVNFLKLDSASPSIYKEIIENAESLGNCWSEFTLRKKATMLKSWCPRIELSSTRLVLHFSIDHLRDSLLRTNIPAIGALDTVVINVQMKRIGMETRLVIDNGKAQTANRDSVKKLQNALLNGLRWSQELRNGNFDSIEGIASVENVSRQYVSRLLGLTSLSPDVMKMIVTGDIPESLTLEKLKDGFPLDWKQQESFFKLSSV